MALVQQVSKKLLKFLVAFSCLITCNAIANAPPTTNALPLPRFASLRSKSVHLHVGPGNNYPIDWKFIRQGLPVEIIAEFDTWRQIRDWQGTQGWIHKSLLSGRRTAWVMNEICSLRKEPDEKSKVIARLEPGVVPKLLECRNKWCRVEAQSPDGSSYRGWINRGNLWGVYAHEAKI